MDRIKEAFDSIHAEDELKDQTVAAVEARLAKKAPKMTPMRYRLAIVACVLVAVLAVGGGVFYLTPTATISVDINPSVELGINHFDRVVSAKGINEDGQQLLDSVSIWNAPYEEAINTLLDSEQATDLLDSGEIASVTVVDSDSEQCDRLLSGVESCTEGRENTSCHAAHEDDVSEAHDEGLSYGKYLLLKKIQEVNPSVTADDVKDMTMREMRDLLAEKTGDTTSDASGSSTSGHNGQGHGGEGQGHGGEGQGHGGEGQGNHHGSHE